jgi:glucosamine kinase
MTTRVNDSELLFLGIDGGGSKCKARLVSSDNTVLGTGISGPANPFHGMEQAISSIADAAALAVRDAGLDERVLQHTVAGMGLAGVNLPGLYRAMTEWQHPFHQMFLATDLHIACLGAHRGGFGAVIIAGTGSCGYIHQVDRSTMFGGHGFPIGDKGSGAWMGLEAVQAVLLALDNLGPATSLSQAISEVLDAEGLAIIEKLARAPSALYGRLAPAVLQQANAGDEVAQAIVQEGADYLSALGEKLLAFHPPRLSILGGLGPLLMPWLRPNVASAIVEPLDQPEAGAILFAQQQWQSEKQTMCS